MGRGGTDGLVLDVFDDGCGLDFFCGRDGDPKGLPSIEHWQWGELEVCECGEHQPRPTMERDNEDAQASRAS